MYSFKLGMFRVQYTDHLGEMYERKHTPYEEDLIDAWRNSKRGSVRSIEQIRGHEAAVLNRMQEFGVNEQHTLKRELS